MSGIVVSARGIRFDRGARTILSGVGLEVGRAEIVALLGANGAGKSTLLRILLKLLNPKEGRVDVLGRPLAAMTRREIASLLAYVPQHHSTPFPYTVAEVVALGRLAATGVLGMPGRQDDAAVASVLERLGIAHLANRDYTAISGGERQLALIARALVQGAQVLMMDEPDAGLDYGNQRRLLDLMRELSQRDYTIIFTTHHPDHALYAASRAVLLDGGGIVADGAPATTLTPELIHRLYGVGVRMVDGGRHRVFAPV